MRRSKILSALNRPIRSFCRDRKGASAIEFALLAMPFVLLLMFILQIGIYYMVQVSLDAGMVRTAEDLRSRFGTGSAPSLPSASALKASLVGWSGGLVMNNSALSVEIQPLANLGAAAVPVTDGLTNYGVAYTVLAVRAKYMPTSFMPGFGSTVTANSSALVRRQGQ